MDRIFTNPQIEIDNLPRYQELKFSSISLKYRTHALLRWGILVVVLAAIWSIALFVKLAIGILMATAITVLGFLAFRFFVLWKEQAHYGFALRAHDIAYTRGYLIKRTTVIPFERIQHVSTSQDIMERFFGITTLHIFTAGGSGSDINIPGLEPDLAARVKGALVLKVDQTS